MATRTKIIPKGYSGSQELQVTASLLKFFKYDTKLHDNQAKLFFECSILNIHWSKPQLKSKNRFSKKKDSYLCNSSFKHMFINYGFRPNPY